MTTIDAVASRTTASPTVTSPAPASSAPTAATPAPTTPAPAAATGSDSAAPGCCSSPRTPVDAPTAELMAARFKALSDPMRLRLLSHIAARGCDSVCACDLLDVVDLSQPTVSHHLRKLVDAGLLTRVQRGRWAYYSVVHEVFDELRLFLDLA